MQGKGGAMGGKYARKAENLTAKELKAAGGAKAAKKRTVSISDTKRVTSGANKGRTVGPGGKPLTGSVKLENGAMAVYKDGKRVTKAPARKPAAGPARSSSGGSSSSGGGSGRPTPPPKKSTPKVGEVRVGAAKKGVNRWDGKKWVPVSNTNATVKKVGTTTSRRPAGGADTISSQSKMPAKSGKPSGNGSPAAKVREWVAGLAVPQSKPPRVGQVKQTMSGRAKWDGKKWVKF
jgi:hypothetical protein